MSIVHRLRQAWLGLTSRSSREYWDRRYSAGMNSGPGSYGDLARFKAEVLNDFVSRMQVHSVIELGCGDGHQLGLARYPLYLGLDVSAGAIDLCLARFAGDATKSFLWYDPRRTRHPANFITADLALSLDVVYHLLEDEVYDAYLGDLFAIARRFVIIYSSDRAEGRSAPHVRHRKFTDDVALRIPEFQLVERIPNRYPAQSFAEFFIFERTGSAPATDAAPVAAGAASAASAAPTVAHKDPRSAPRSPRG